MKPSTEQESVFAGKKRKVTYTLVQDLIELTKETSSILGMSESDFINGLLTAYFEERGLYKMHSFREQEWS